MYISIFNKKDFFLSDKMDKVKQLLQTYNTHAPSERCYLDGRYFNEVLKEYPGLSPNPIVLRISERECRMTEGEGWEQEFELKELTAGPVNVKLNPQFPDLVRVIIEVDQVQNGSVAGSVRTRHSNLLIVDPRDKRCYRFEPLQSHKYFQQVNDALELFVSVSLPDYQFVSMEQHPQMVEDDRKCAGKGMCIAYVLLMACLFVGEQPLKISDDPQHIYRFAGAVEHMYQVEQGGYEDIEYGWASTLGGAAIGTILTGGLGGLLVGALAGSALGGAYNSSQRYGHNYGPNYKYNNWPGSQQNGWRGGYPMNHQYYQAAPTQSWRHGPSMWGGGGSFNRR